MWGALTVSVTLGLPPFTPCVLSQSTLLRLQVSLQGNSLKWALGCVDFPGLSHSGSGSQVLHKGTDSVGPAFVPFPGPSSSGTRCLVSTLSPSSGCLLLPPPSQPLSFLGTQQARHLRCTVCLFWGADLWLRPSWWMSTIQNPRKSWLATGSLLAVW